MVRVGDVTRCKLKRGLVYVYFANKYTHDRHPLNCMCVSLSLRRVEAGT